MSLDGFIADRDGKAGWIVMDPEIDFAALTERYDTILMGRKSYEESLRQFGTVGMPGMQTCVVSRTLRQADCPGAVVSDDPEKKIAELRSTTGKDIWLFGGGHLFRSLLELGLVDEIQVAVVPVLLGGGVPFLPGLAECARLRLKKYRVFEKTGTVLLDYSTT